MCDRSHYYLNSYKIGLISIVPDSDPFDGSVGFAVGAVSLVAKSVGVVEQISQTTITKRARTKGRKIKNIYGAYS